MRAYGPEWFRRSRSSRFRRWWRRGLWGLAEGLVTLGVVLLLLVVHQLWWTNLRAQRDAERSVERLEEEWGEPSQFPSGLHTPSSSSSSSAPRSPSASRPSVSADSPRPYAILTIPRLDLRVPVARGVGKAGVLNKGYAGHYPGTQEPGQAGNFAVAGHRNTHGEPFRYVDRLRAGDEVVVETGTAVYVYRVDQTLDRTSPGDVGVVGPVPRSAVRPGAGYREPGYYLTLTTCTPEYSSAYRLIVWGKLVSMRPR
ncbi:class E sortase [Streptomyces sp. NPDC048290]|uniref:class E sortase n=1 Tax=Streptomyces sp. NPDC048290 TaxID=3155811 RepID=UPI0034348E2C